MLVVEFLEVAHFVQHLLFDQRSKLALVRHLVVLLAGRLALEPLELILHRQAAQDSALGFGLPIHDPLRQLPIVDLELLDRLNDREGVEARSLSQFGAIRLEAGAQHYEEAMVLLQVCQGRHPDFGARVGEQAQAPRVASHPT